TEAGEQNHCGTLGASTRWFGIGAALDGYSFVVDTAGSAKGTVLAVYTGSSFADLTFITNDCAFSPGSYSKVQFVAARNVPYWIAVDGTNGVEGEVHLNIGLGKLVVTPTTTLKKAHPGSTVTLAPASIDADPAPTFR